MSRLWLIARREIVAYTGVASFWVALLLGPLLMGLTGLASTALVPAKAPQQTVSAAENSPIVPMNSSTGIPFRICTFLKT